MMLRLIAIIENPDQRENLRHCINILGEIPCIHKDSVCVTLPRDDARAEKFVELFENYTRHKIQYV